MPLTTGTRLGPYEIVAPLGTGGMGEVYKARDTRLDRTVAVKVSKENFSERFEREARAIAALNHPHICQLYDVGPNYLVMEYVDGTPLAGPLSADETLRFATQICDALDAAHRKGIVHRDLKPANILITRRGGPSGSPGVKLLDFGLARIAASAEDPTLTSAGDVMGTPAYMAPEQWEGKSADVRTDIYAFGCVLHEMLTGKRAAQERTPVEPASFEHILRGCLTKDPDDRWQSARDLRRALELPASVSVVTRRTWRVPMAWAIAAIGVATALFFAVRPSPAPVVGDVVRLSFVPPEKTTFTGQRSTTVGAPQLALSPDGRTIVFVAAAPGARPTLWLRSLGGATHSLPGTEGAEFPFWSPDNLWVGYFAEGKLKKSPVAGGPSQTIADVPDPRPASWGPNETILFSTGTTGILRVSSSGGMVTPVTELDASHQEGSHRFPEFLPDGAHFVFQVRSSKADHTGLYAGSLDRKTKKLLLRGNTSALYAPSGHLLFLDGDTLMGQAFDADRLELRGQVFLVEDGIGRSSAGYGSYSVSDTGTLAYAGTLSTPGQLTWLARNGSASGSVGPPADYTDFRLSPDQTHLAASLADAKTGLPDIWVTDLTRGSSTPFTFGPAVNASAVWAPDGGRIIFRTTRSGGLGEFYVKSAGGGGQEESVVSQTAMRASGVGSATLPLWDWSPDGRHLLFSAAAPSDYDLWLVSVATGAKPVTFLRAPGDQWHGNFSPDSRLVAYSSSESGRFEVHVQTFPLSDRQWTVSTEGGYEPRWRADGREIYYLSADQKLMAVSVGAGPSFGAPRQLFQTRIEAGVSSQRTHYAPSRDGQRFLINTLSGDPMPTPITVVLNWTAALKK